MLMSVNGAGAEYIILRIFGKANILGAIGAVIKGGQ
jgi:hypothetical protein